MRGKRVYFDAMVFIYLVEGFPTLHDALLEIRDSLLHAEAEVVTSELTLCETLVLPFRNNDAGLISKYRQFIENSGAFEVCPVNRDTLIRASLYRAQFGFKTPDAIHVASAIGSGCEIFLTNDAKIRSPGTLKVLDFRAA